jgi:hypothetical protein
MQWESYLQRIQLWIPSLTVENDVRGAVIPALCRDRLFNAKKQAPEWFGKLTNLSPG